MRYFIYAFWGIILLIVAIFAVLNSQVVTIHYYFGELKIYFPLFMLLEIVIGILLGMAFMLPAVLRAKNTGRKHKRRVKEVEQEVTNLRNIPIKDSR